MHPGVRLASRHVPCSFEGQLSSGAPRQGCVEEGHIHTWFIREICHAGRFLREVNFLIAGVHGYWEALMGDSFYPWTWYRFL